HRFFFFSSRRRHTRWPRDWSSDVCSSDLNSVRQTAVCRFAASRFRGDRPFGQQRQTKVCRTTTILNVSALLHQSLPSALDCPARSEERRVGKECRSRWWLDQRKEKVQVTR